MPVVHKNTMKAARQAVKRRARNPAVMSGVKGVVKKLQSAIQQKQTSQATELLRQQAARKPSTLSGGSPASRTFPKDRNELTRSLRCKAPMRSCTEPHVSAPWTASTSATVTRVLGAT